MRSAILLLGALAGVLAAPAPSVEPQTKIRKCKVPKTTTTLDVNTIPTVSPATGGVSVSGSMSIPSMSSEALSMTITMSEPAISTPTISMPAVTKSGKGEGTAPVNTIPTVSPITGDTSVSMPSKTIDLGLSTTLSVSIPTKTGSSGGSGSDSCPVPKISGGDFGILGELTGNLGMLLNQMSGSCSVGVFAGKTKRDGAMSAAVDGLTASASLSGLFAGHNFCQITGKSGPATQSICGKVPLCQGKKYSMSVLGAADVGSAVQLQFSVGGTQVSEAKPCQAGGMSAAASFGWDFTWAGETAAEVEACIIATIAGVEQSVGLAQFSCEAAL